MSSILVRKHCQPVLDEAGYSMFYATISGDHWEPCLTIFTNCGQEFVTIEGVKFSRVKPTIAECEFAAVLLKQWLDRHAQDFAEFVDAHVDYFSAEAPEPIKVTPGLSVSMYSGKIRIHRKFNYKNDDGVVQEKEMIFSLDQTATMIQTVSWGCNLSGATLNRLIKLPVSAWRTAAKFLQEHEDYKARGKRLEEAAAAIKICKI